MMCFPLPPHPSLVRVRSHGSIATSLKLATQYTTTKSILKYSIVGFLHTTACLSCNTVNKKQRDKQLWEGSTVSTSD